MNSQTTVVSDQIFLSYSKVDFALAQQLDESLTSAGFNVWFDERKLMPGQAWELEIAKALRDSRVVLMCFTKQSVERRGYFQKEVRLTIELMQEVPAGSSYAIPVRLEDCPIPESLASVQWANAFERQGFERLVAVLSSELGFGPQEAALASREALLRYFEDPAEGIDERVRTLEARQRLQKRLLAAEPSIVRLFEQALEVLDADQGFVAVHDMQNYLRILACRGTYLHLPVDQGLVGRAFVTGESIVADPESDNNFRVTMKPIVGEIIVPLFLEGRPVGVVLLDRTRPPAFSSADLSRLLVFAREISTILGTTDDSAEPHGA